MTDEDDPLCNQCGQLRSAHGIDQYSGKPVKCPVSPADSGHTVANNEGARERRNMQRAQADLDGPACAHRYGDPHEAMYEQRDGSSWVPVCQDHVDPTKEVRELHTYDR